MRRWISEYLDDAFLPLLKIISPGFRRRMPPFRPAGACDMESLADLQAPDEVSLVPEPAWRGFESLNYRFESPVDCGCAENSKVSGRLLIADREAPWTLIVPGYATGALPPFGYSLFQDVQGRALLERGFNVALIDTPFHMSRKRPGCLSGEGFFSPDLQEMQSTFRQAAADSIALVRWLRREFGRPVSIWGTSLGGCIAGLTATQERDLAAVVLMEPLDNPGDALRVLPACHEIRSEVIRHGMDPEHIPQALQGVAPSSYRPSVPAERILFVTPLWDRVVPTQFQVNFWEAWGKPRRIAIQSGHVTLAANRALTAQIVDFIGKRVAETAH